MKNKKLIYIVNESHLKDNPNSLYGIAVRTKEGDLNKFFPYIYQQDGDVALVNTKLFEHLRELKTVYGAEIRWDYSSFAW